MQGRCNNYQIVSQSSQRCDGYQKGLILNTALECHGWGWEFCEYHAVLITLREVYVCYKKYKVVHGCNGIYIIVRSSNISRAPCLLNRMFP